LTSASAIAYDDLYRKDAYKDVEREATGSDREGKIAGVPGLGQSGFIFLSSQKGNMIMREP
jgi:hypothetical protein